MIIKCLKEDAPKKGKNLVPSERLFKLTCLTNNAFKVLYFSTFCFVVIFIKRALGFFSSCLVAYQVGYLSASIRSVADARVGDTVTHYFRRAENSLPGYEEATPMVFCGLFPVDADQYCSCD